MGRYVYFDSIRLNPATGGVLNVSDLLLRHLRESPHDEVDVVSERFGRLYRLFDCLRINRFVFDTLIYNWYLVLSQRGEPPPISLFPNYFLPFALFGRHSNSIVVVHDLQYKAFPEYFGRCKVAWLDWSLRRISESCANVVFISKSSKNDFVRYFGRCGRSTVILNPVEAGVPAIMPLEYTDTPRYLIAAYHYYPHKNFAGVLRLFAQMRKSGLVDKLYVTGNGSVNVERMVARISPELSPFIVLRGLVPKDELVRLYLGALAFVSLSSFEGFNLSAAEAATLGVPLLLSDIPVHCELFKGYGLLLPKETGADVAQIAEYLKSHVRQRPSWAYRDACTPKVVARNYLMLRDNPEHAA